MEKEIVTIQNIEDSLYTLDTEYREALAKCMMQLNYVSDSPLNLYYGTKEQQKELIRVMNEPLKTEQVKEIINYIMDKMKGDYQYNEFESIALKYINISKEIELEEEEEYE